MGLLLIEASVCSAKEPEGQGERLVGADRFGQVLWLGPWLYSL